MLGPGNQFFKVVRIVSNIKKIKKKDIMKQNENDMYL